MYYVTKNGEQKGPYEENVILACLKDGTFDDSDFIWKEGWADWKEIGAVFTKPSATPPPAPAPKQAEPPTKATVEKRGFVIGKPAIFGVLGLLFLLYIANPYIATYQLFAALKSGDTGTLKKRIDFPELRESLKEEMKAKMLQETKKTVSKASKEDDPMAALGAGLAAAIGPALIDGIVDSFVTPSGLAGLISNPEAAVQGKGGSGDIRLPNINWAFFSGLTEFKIKNKEGVSLFLHLQGISWSLYRISWSDDGNNVSIAKNTPTIPQLNAISSTNALAGYWKLENSANVVFWFKSDGTVTVSGQKNGTYAQPSPHELKIKIEDDDLTLDVLSQSNTQIELSNKTDKETRKMTFIKVDMDAYNVASSAVTKTMDDYAAKAKDKKNAMLLASLSGAVLACSGNSDTDSFTSKEEALLKLVQGINIPVAGTSKSNNFKADMTVQDAMKASRYLSFRNGGLYYEPNTD